MSHKRARTGPKGSRARLRLVRTFACTDLYENFFGNQLMSYICMICISIIIFKNEISNLVREREYDRKIMIHTENLTFHPVHYLQSLGFLIVCDSIQLFPI